MSANRIILIISILLAGVIIFICLCKLSTYNYQTCYIKTRQHGFVLMVKGERHTIVQDLISLFRVKRFQDSMQYTIPRDQGIIKGEEVAAELGYRKPLGTITIQKSKCKINLFNYNINKRRLESDTWNGEYNLHWLK